MRILEGILLNLIAAALVWLGGFLLEKTFDLGGTELKPKEILCGQTINNYFSGNPEPKPDPPVRRPPPELQVSSDLQCTDHHGHKGAFQAMIFLDAYNWVLGSTELVEFNGQLIPYFPTVLRQEPIQKVLAGAEEIVAVGTASCESRLGFLVENRRAEQRAEQLVRWIEESRGQLPSRPGPMRSVIPLSLGRFTKECPGSPADETARQRRIVLIAVTDRQKDLDLESCLQDRMKEDSSLKFLTENYSKFDLDPGFK